MDKPTQCADHGNNVDHCTNQCDYYWSIFDNDWVPLWYWRLVNSGGSD